MASIHQSVQLSASEPRPHAPHSPDPRRNLSSSDTPSSPREGKRKRLTHEVSSPNITAKQRKQSQPNRGEKSNRHSIIIEPPMRCTAWDASSQSDYTATKSETSSLHSEVSIESFVEMDEKSMTRIRYIINELITTEKVYMQDLHDIATGYMQPMEQCSDLFPPELVKDIFINIKPVGDFHLDFLMKLDEYQQELDALVNCFLTKESEEGFSLYNEFCRKVPRSLDLIAEQLTNDHSKQFILECQQQLHHFFPLSEFLHRPIQRILKYPLLLRDIQKHTSGTKYASVVEAALDKITGVAIHINNVKRVQELDSNEITGWTGKPLLEYGVLKLEDSFKVNGSDGRYLFLFEKLLLFTKPHKDGKYQYKAHLLPTEIILTDNNIESLKFEIENFHQKKIKFVVQVADLDVKKNWVYEIRRCVLEHQPNITPAMREVLLKGIPNMDRANQLDDILSSSKYKSFILLQGLDRDIDNGPVTPDMEAVHQIHPLSPTQNTPSPIGQFAYNTPSPDRIPHDDSGIEDPAPKNQVDYSSLDVKAIKDRWIRQDKLITGSNTAPVRAFHRRNSPARALQPDKMETWPLPDGESPVEQLKKNNKVASMLDSLKQQEQQAEPSRSEPPLKSPSPTKESSMMKPCLARISHLQEQPDKATPVYRGIQGLIEADAANSQVSYKDILSPDSNNHPDCEGESLFSALDSSSAKHPVVSPKQSNGADDAFNNQPNSNTIKTNLDKYTKQEKGLKSEDSLELSDNDELIVTFRKGCNISGTDTTKRNSFIIDKELHKSLPIFSPQSSDSETSDMSESSASRIERFKARYAKQKHKIEKQEADSRTDSRTETNSRADEYDYEASKSRTPSPEDVIEISDKMSTLTTSPRSTLTFAGRAIKTETPRSKSRTPEPDDRTLTRDEDTLTRDKDTLTRENSHLVYQGSSLIRGAKNQERDDDEEKIVMKPIRSSEKSASKSKTRLRRAAAAKDEANDDSSEDEATKKRSSGLKKRSGLPKPSAIPRSDSNSSIPSTRTKTPTNNTEARSRTNSANKSGTFVKPAVKNAALRTRTPSFNQEDNPFSTECKRATGRQPRAGPGTVGRQATADTATIGRRATADTATVGRQGRADSATMGRQARAGTATGTTTRQPGTDTATIGRQSGAGTTRPRRQSGTDTTRTRRQSGTAASATKSLPTEQAEPGKPRGTRLCSDGLASNRRLAYLHAASKSTANIKTESDADIQELNSVRSSQLVAKMKSQLLTTNSTKIKGPTRSSTLKRRYVRSNTTHIEPRSRSSPASSRRSSSAEYKPPERRSSIVQRKESNVIHPPERKQSTPQRKQSTPQRKQSTMKRTPEEVLAKPSLTRTNTMIKRSSATQKPLSRPGTAPGKRQNIPGQGSGRHSTGVRRPTRIPSPTKSPPCSEIKTSSSSSRLVQQTQTPSGMRPKSSSGTSRIQKSTSSSRVLKNSSSTSGLQYDREQCSEGSSRTNSPVKRSGLSIKTPSRVKQRHSGVPARSESPGLSTRSTSLADLNKVKRTSAYNNPNLSQLQTLSKSMSSVNEKSARQARREAARSRGAARAAEAVTPKSAGSESKARKKFLYGASRTYSVV